MVVFELLNQFKFSSGRFISKHRHVLTLVVLVSSWTEVKLISWDDIKVLINVSSSLTGIDRALQSCQSLCPWFSIHGHKTSVDQYFVVDFKSWGDSQRWIVLVSKESDSCCVLEWKSLTSNYEFSCSDIDYLRSERDIEVSLLQESESSIDLKTVKDWSL